MTDQIIDPRRSAAQPEKCHPFDPQEPARRPDRRVRLGQIHAWLRHPAQGRPAPIPGIARAGHLWAGEAAGRRHQRAFPIDQRGPASHQPQPALHGRHDHRGLYLSARAVCPPGTPPLPGLRQRRCRLPSTQPTRNGRAKSGADDDAAAPGRNLPLPALRRAGAGDRHGPLLLQQAGGGLPDLHRAGQRPSGQPQAPGRRAKEHPGGRGRRLGCAPHIDYYTGTLQAAAAHYGFAFDLSLPVKDYTPAAARPAVLRRGEPPLPPPLPAGRAAGHRPPGALRRHRHQSPAPLRRTRPPNTSTRPITATGWRNSWSPRPVPTAPARACARKAGP